jgi:hypothetical protein
MEVQPGDGPTGRDLLAYREWRGVRRSQLAAVMGCSYENVKRIEGLRRLTPTALRRYLDALARLEGRPL